MEHAFRMNFYCNDAPCKDCGERSAGCHSKCSKYGQFREKIEEGVRNFKSYQRTFSTLTPDDHHREADNIYNSKRNHGTREIRYYGVR